MASSMNRLLHVLQAARTLGEPVQLALVYSYGPVSAETLEKISRKTLQVKKH
jgi:hypothetical protein